MNKKHSRTFINIALYIGITMLIIVMSLGGVFYLVFEKQGLQTISVNNDRLLSEVGFHLGYINQVNTNYCRTQFDDYEVQSIVTSKDNEDMYQTNRMIQKIKKSIAVSDMVDSVILYNGLLDEYYSTNDWICKQDEEIVEMIHSNLSDENFLVLPRYIYNESTKKYDKKVLSYIMMERYVINKEVASAVIVNVNMECMLGNLSDRGVNSNELEIIREDGEILLNHNESISCPSFIEEELLEMILSNDSGSFVNTIDGEKRVISYQHVPQTNWILIHSQSYDEMFQMIGTIRIKMYFIIFISLLIGLVGTLIIAKVIYKPMGVLFQNVMNTYLTKESDELKRNEIEYLQGVFENQQEQLKKYNQFKVSSESKLRSNYIKNMLLENTVNNDTIRNDIMDITLDCFCKEEELIMILLTVSNYCNVAADDIEERNLIRFIISNITNEVMEDYGKVEVVPMSGGEFVVLMNSKKQEHSLEHCKSLLDQIEENIYNVTKLMISAFVDRVCYNNQALSYCYKELQKLTRYTLIYDIGCILFAEDIRQEKKNSILDYPQELENKILEMINKSDYDGAMLLFKKFMLCISEYSLEHYIACVNKLELAIQTYVKQINEHKLIKIQVDYNSMYQQIQSAETSEQIISQFASLFKHIIEQMPYSAVKKNDTMIKLIQEYVMEHYKSKELCVKSIAASFDMSTAYLSMLFKENTKCSIQEYINHARLEEAQKLVLETNFSITQVMELCGFESSSSFYRLYKAYFGVAPKEHRIKKRMEQEMI